MSNTTRILELAQSIYRAKNNRTNDVEGAEETAFIEETIDWVNQLIEELEDEADWNFSRENNVSIGTVRTAATTSFALPATINRLVFSPERDLTIQQDGTVISTFRLVKPNQIADPNNPATEDRATVIGRNVILSRELDETEVGGTVHADVIYYIPRLSLTNVRALDTVKPKQLLILGVAKNSTLPDIVQGGISSTLNQKYNRLLRNAIAKNEVSSEAQNAYDDDLSYITGVR